MPPTLVIGSSMVRRPSGGPQPPPDLYHPCGKSTTASPTNSNSLSFLMSSYCISLPYAANSQPESSSTLSSPTRRSSSSVVGVSGILVENLLQALSIDRFAINPVTKFTSDNFIILLISFDVIFVDIKPRYGAR